MRSSAEGWAIPSLVAIRSVQMLFLCAMTWWENILRHRLPRKIILSRRASISFTGWDCPIRCSTGCLYRSPQLGTNPATHPQIMSAEIIEFHGTKYAEVIRADVGVQKTRFFSPPESSFQFGLLAHEAGFSEPAHYHKPFQREISDLQQMFVMQRGVVVIELYSDEGDLFGKRLTRAGWPFLLLRGVV